MAAAATATNASSVPDNGHSGWACALCTFENQSNAIQCAMCTTPRPSPNGAANQSDNNQSVDNGWKCILCTFVNGNTVSACSVCGAPSPISTDLTGKQICAACTTVNAANSHQCIVCGAALSGQIIQKDDKGDLILQDAPMIPQSNTNSTPTDTDQNGSPFMNGFGTFGGDDFSHQPPYYAIDPTQPLGGPLQSFPIYASNQSDANYQFQPLHYQPQPYQQQQHKSPFGHHHDAMNQVKRSPKRRKLHRSRHRSRYSSHHNHPIQDDEEDFKFKDVTEIFKNDAEDTERIKKEEEEVKQLSKMYETVYLTKKKHFNHDSIAEVVTGMKAFIPQEHWDEVAKANQQQNEQESKTDVTTCGVCFCEFDDDEGKLIVMEEHCNHAMCCKSCFIQHLAVKIKDDDITPWLPCPAENCKAPVSCGLLLEYVTLENLYKFAAGFIRKHLARNPNWVRCGTSKCEYGFMILDADTSKKHKLRCGACKKKQTVSKDPIQEEGFDELIKSGVLRLCPKCSLPTMKDKGMCNVMHCGKCGIYWNWKTRETGTSSSQLKNKARRNGTLWEPGELRYQQELQRNNLPEFKKLLERNGIKYDPNYVRGTR